MGMRTPSTQQFTYICLAFALSAGLWTCSGKTDPGTSDTNGSTDTNGTKDSSTTSDSSGGNSHDTWAYIEGPPLSHADPTEGVMCFDCHLCANEGAEALEVTHYVCRDCHTGPNGEVSDDAAGFCGCGDLDCSVDPPVLGCENCHTDGTNGYESAEQMNEHCSHCHASK